MAKRSLGETYDGRIIGTMRKIENYLIRENSVGGNQECYLLRIEALGDPTYWMHIDLPLSWKLIDIDAFLRDVWLECCGHLSAFTPHSRSFDEFPKSTMVKRFEEGTSLYYVYDFGSSTELAIHFLAKGKREKVEGIRWLSCNLPPVHTCCECGKEAKVVIFGDYYCEECHEHHEHANCSLEIVNSPRCGVCGYEDAFTLKEYNEDE